MEDMEMRRRIIWVDQQEPEKTSWRQEQLNKELFMLVVDCLLFLLMVYAQSSCCSHVIKPCFVDYFSLNGFTPTWAYTLFQYNEERRRDHAFGVAWSSNPGLSTQKWIMSSVLRKAFPLRVQDPLSKGKKIILESKKTQLKDIKVISKTFKS